MDCDSFVIQLFNSIGIKIKTNVTTRILSLKCVYRNRNAVHPVVFLPWKVCIVHPSKLQEFGHIKMVPNTNAPSAFSFPVKKTVGALWTTIWAELDGASLKIFSFLHLFIHYNLPPSLVVPRRGHHRRLGVLEPNLGVNRMRFCWRCQGCRSKFGDGGYL